MALTDQDREWVRAIIQEAALQTLNRAREQADMAVAAHQRNCTFILKSRALLWGMVIGAGLSGSGLTLALQQLFH